MLRRKRPLKDVAADTKNEKGKAIDVTEKKAQVAENARLTVEKRLTEVEAKLGGIELKLVEAKSLTLA